MSFVVKKLPLAEQDALEAAIWYEERQPGLGDEFLSEADRAVEALSESALLHRIRFADVRRAPIHRFNQLKNTATSLSLPGMSTLASKPVADAVDVKCTDDEWSDWGE